MKIQAKILCLYILLFLAFQAALICSADPVHLDRKGEKWANSTLHKMTLEEKVGQMIMVWARVRFLNVHSPDFLQLLDEMHRYHVGGFGVTVATDGPLLIKSEPLEAAALTNELQKESKYPLIFAADFERGLAMRLNGATEFPSAMAFGAAGDPELARAFGRISAEESRAIGIQWNWFPVSDVNSNPANPIINTRSFSGDPAQVGTMIAAYIQGAREAGMLTTAKHFPGHGDTDTDSHIGLAKVTASVDRLNHLELVPFRSAIAAGVDSVMIGHITVPAIEPEPNRPASISSAVITGLLKQQMGFKGLVVTDALDMGALMRVFTGSDSEISGAEAVAAVQAGNDMVLIPADLDGAYNGLLNAVKDGRISQQRVDESVLKILRMKASVGLNRSRFVDLDATAQQIARPENVAIAQKVADKAITLVADKNKLVPFSNVASRSAGQSDSDVVAAIFTDYTRGGDGDRAFASALRQHAPNASIFYINGGNSASLANAVLEEVSRAKRVIALADSVPTPRRTTQGQANGSLGLDVGPAELLNRILDSSAEKTVFVAFGSPYLESGISLPQSYVCTFSDSVPSAISLANALFGGIPVSGRLPVAIPRVASRGDGLDREPVSRASIAQSLPGSSRSE